MGLKSWAKSRRDRGTPYEATAARLTRHCRFLLSLHPATGDRPVGWLVQEFKAFTAAATTAVTSPTLVSPTPTIDTSPAFPSAPPIPRRRSPSPTNRGLTSSRSFAGGTSTSSGLSGSSSGRRWSGFASTSEAGSGSLLRALEMRHAERLSLVMGFLKGGIDLCRLRAAQIAADGRARRRAAGLIALRSLLAATGREGSSGVKAALLLYVPPALRGVLHGLAALGPDPIALQVRLKVLLCRFVNFPPALSLEFPSRKVVAYGLATTKEVQKFSVLPLRLILNTFTCRWRVRLLRARRALEAQRAWVF